MDLELFKPDFFNYLLIELNRSPRTVEGYRKDLRVFGRYLQSAFQREHWNITEITTGIISDFLKYLTTELQYKPRTVRRHLAAIKSLYNFAVLEEYIDKSPAENISAPRIPQRQPFYLEKNQIESLFLTVTSENPSALRDLTIIKTLFYSGIRVLELVNLKREDIDFQEHSLKVREGKGSKQRLIPLHPELEKQYKIYLAEGPHCNDDFLFCNIRKNGLTTEYIRYIIAHCASEAGLPLKVTPHVLRHSFATILYKECDVDLKRLSQLLGHSSLRHTIVYAHSSIEHLREAVELLPSPGESGIRIRYKTAAGIDPRTFENDKPVFSGNNDCLALEEVTGRYLNYRKYVQNFSESTCLGDAKSLELFYVYLKERVFQRETIQIREIRTAHLRQFLHYLHNEKKYKVTSSYTHVVHLKSFFKYLHYQGYLDKNPAQKLVLPKRPQREINYLKWDEVEQLFNAPNPASSVFLRDVTIFKTFYYTGLRLNELSSLMLEDLSDDLSTLTIISGKGDKTRLIPVHSHLQEALDIYIKKGRPASSSSYLFTTHKGKNFKKGSYMNIFIKHARRTAISGKQVNPHMMRHTFATHLYQGGADLKRISLLLGHVNINHTAVYTHTSLEHLHEAIKLL